MFPYLVNIPHHGKIEIRPFDKTITESWMLRCSRILVIRTVQDEKATFRNLAIFRYFDVVTAIKNREKGT